MVNGHFQDDNAQSRSIVSPLSGYVSNPGVQWPEDTIPVALLVLCSVGCLSSNLESVISGNSSNSTSSRFKHTHFLAAFGSPSRLVTLILTSIPYNCIRTSFGTGQCTYDRFSPVSFYLSSFRSIRITYDVSIDLIIDFFFFFFATITELASSIIRLQKLNHTHASRPLHLEGEGLGSVSDHRLHLVWYLWQSVQGQVEGARCDWGVCH